MKTTAQRRFAGLAGLLLLALLIVAVSVPAALATNAAGSGSGGVSYSWARAASGPTDVAAAPAGTLGRGGVAAPIAAAAPAPVAAASEPASSGLSSTQWILIGVAAAIAAGLVTWALVSRRRRLAASTERYCALHPSDALCGAA
jgi:hypothetical protein